jgi:hypothetical protein
VYLIGRGVANPSGRGIAQISERGVPIAKWKGCGMAQWTGCDIGQWNEWKWKGVCPSKSSSQDFIILSHASSVPL